jgi:hypothetical protein
MRRQDTGIQHVITSNNQQESGVFQVAVYAKGVILQFELTGDAIVLLTGFFVDIMRKNSL